jgi:hypothetical protein
MPTKFIVFEEFVSPPDLQRFRDRQNDAVKLWKETNWDVPVWSYFNDDNAYYWVVPIQNFASIDALYQKMGAMSKEMKEKGFDGEEAFRDLSTIRHSIIEWVTDLSYHPSGEMGQTLENTYVEWTFCYMRAGHEKEAAKVIKKYQNFYDKVDDSFEWDVYRVMMGHDTPCWILMTRANSEASMKLHQQELQEKYGDDFQVMWAEFEKHVRKFERKKGWFVPAWSLNVLAEE